MGSRTKARARVLQILYAWELRGGNETLRLVQEEFSPRGLKPLDPEVQGYADRLLSTIERERPRIDGRLAALAENWRLSRMTTVDRNILRIAAAEMLYLKEVPLRVSVHEAIRLAEWFGSDDSRRFINGVLDGLLREIEANQPTDAR
ncbi:MAG: transcription antitermination factor NusB [Gemmatimonadota bacterium]|nr:MAG: transcription antitermination factor NusB [Gemmatimonadota bacterium]